MSLQQDFSKLQPCDLILCGPGVTYVVVRNIDVSGQERYVLGELCRSHGPYDSEAHPEKILPHAYAWNDGLLAFVDRDGDWLRGWSNEIEVERGAYRGSDLTPFAIVGVVDENVGERLVVNKALSDQLDIIATYSGHPELALLETAKLFGFGLTFQQAQLIFEVMHMNVELQKTRDEMAEDTMGFATGSKDVSGALATIIFMGVLEAVRTR